MSARLRTIVLSASALWQLSTAKPADPTITTAAVLPRQNNDNFIGYLEVNSTWSSIDCNPGLTWYQSGQYAQCCPTSLARCYAPTACVGGSQFYTYPDISSATTIACTANYNNTALSVCNTIFIYENTQDSHPKTNINCGDSNMNWSYYRSIPASKTDSVETSSTSSSPGPSTTAKPETGSKAWIAGAVLGPVLGLALVGAVVFFFLGRKKKAAQRPQYGTASMAHFDPSQPPTGVGGYTDAKPHFPPAQPTYYNQPGQPDPYAQQGYPQQGGFSPPQISPTSQYGFQSANNATVNPPLGTFGHNARYEATSGAAELGGDSNGIAPITSSAPGAPQPDESPASPAAELSGAEARSDHLNKQQ